MVFNIYLYPLSFLPSSSLLLCPLPTPTTQDTTTSTLYPRIKQSSVQGISVLLPRYFHGYQI